MNMWAGYPEFLDFLAEDFKDFLANVEEGDLKSEYLLPNIVDKLLKEERANVKVLETQDRWFGVRISAINSILGAVSGVYDYDSVQINGASKNVDLESGQMPVLGTVKDVYKRQGQYGKLRDVETVNELKTITIS